MEESQIWSKLLNECLLTHKEEGHDVEYKAQVAKTSI